MVVSIRSSVLVDTYSENGLGLISDEIREGLGIDVSVLMGANIANEVARDQFCESTVGGFGENAKVFKELFQRPTFRYFSQ